MTIVFTGRKVDLTSDLKSVAEKKLSKLERILHESPDIHVILTREKHRHRIEILVRARAGKLTARGQGAVMRDALAEAIDRILAQGRKHHEKWARGRKRRGPREAPEPAPVEGVPARLESDGPAVVPMGRVPVKPMSVEEALLLMQDSPHPFFVFRDADSQQVSVIFRRRDGHFGLIEPET
ncbi:MAG TPA: ribosome-associated translation inhibitor RaiA [Candidatus Polarisedimenticolia bacterium]|jgi:putative sigma-54 modulation protein|nr:ribosome-associated translation inhibitor RaiA [Candidatus Polarisedimenticolia bacterium]